MMDDRDVIATDKEFAKKFDERLDAIRKRELIDAKFGYQRCTDATTRVAWLLNVQPSEIYDERTKAITAATDFYFLQDDGERFKISYPFRPYLYLAVAGGHEFAVAAYISTRYAYADVERVEKEDLDLKNHLSGLRSIFLRISFPSTVELSVFKKELWPLVRRNKERLENASEYSEMLAEHLGGRRTAQERDVSEQIVDMREHDLPYHMRVCIDRRIFVGLWYTVVGRQPITHAPSIMRNHDVVDPPDPVVCAYDIETTKQRLKFPDSELDQIMMISYMIDGAGFLIINRSIVSEDIEDFEYTPRPEFRGEFTVFNVADERATIQCFFDHLLRVRPSVMVTYNGDFFDWPFVDARASVYGMSMRDYIGFYKDAQDEYKHNNCIHMDAFKWVVRDSYLPMGSQNLKATTKAKLHYDPVELDPELMVDMARHEPKTLANYSVSDAVATYYLYMKYVHPFIFALCTIIPLGPDDVLRKGSGTLCEALLMVEAFHKNIIFPNKQIQADHRMTADGHVLDSETYVGGHVEALESGVFRADVPCRFRLDPEALMELRKKVTATMTHALVTEMNIRLKDVADFQSVCADVQSQLDRLIEQPTCTENPKIYHLDVGAMYPNIILTNRLQPPAVVTEEECLACVYNHPDAKCKRDMNWVWRGEMIPATKGEYERLMQQLEQERFGKPPKPFHLLPKEERDRIEKKRVQDFCRKAYGKLHVTRTEKRTTTICQRENAFYVDTVLAFRDRRYEYKAMLKKAKGVAATVADDDISGQKQAQARIVLYESLQLAHKCILNSFYGYAMRKGSRWFSMEMAGIVCHTGSNIITEARRLVERIGRPLELDTDGIWCLLPSSFPENYDVKLKSGKSVTVSYPGAMLNELVKDKFTNDQYHNLQPDGSYTISSENSIFFEVDGPYLAMILPASKEEGKKLKKRYAVFNFDGSLAELKGFEVKRRGELAIIKHFQTAVFGSFLRGSTLAEIYANVAVEANYWMDILFTKGVDLPNEELFELIGENRSMSKKLEDYGAQKSTSITTAKRLAEFLGDEMVKNAGLACKFIISKYPQDQSVTERTIPLMIFQADPTICCHYLKKWTKNYSLTVDTIDIRELIDWNYYIERVGSCIQKIVTIPAAMQGLPNPVPRVPHPKWLENLRRERGEMHAQPRITDMFKSNKLGSVKRTPIVGQSQTLSSAVSRKRLQPPADYDESNSRLQKFYPAPDEEESGGAGENSVSVFQGLIKDPMELPSRKRRKPLSQGGDAEDDDEDGSLPRLEDLEAEDTALANDDSGDAVIVEDDENARDCYALADNTDYVNRNKPAEGGGVGDMMAENGAEFWKRPLRGKHFSAAKSKTVAATKNCSIAALLARAGSVGELPARKTWTGDGFAEWLNYLKAKWRFQLLTRTRERDAILRCDNVNTPRRVVGGVTTPSSQLLERKWMSRHGPILHILQIVETKIAGQFTVFALGEDGMRRFNLSIPRAFYVDDLRTRDSENCRLVQKILPKMRPSANLYEYIVDEAQFATRINELNAEMCSTRINGIYETQVPLLYKAIVQMGAVFRLDNVRNASSVSFEQMHKVNRVEADYIGMDAIRLMYFYEFTQTNRTVFAFFSPSTAEGYVFIVNRSPVEVANPETLYCNEFNKFVNNRGTDFLDDNCQRLAVQIVQATGLREAAQRLHTIVRAMKFSPTEPIVLCVQTARSTSALLHDFKFLGEFPHVRLNVAESASLMNVLDWASMMTKRSIQHFFNSFVYMKDYWFMAQYVGLPVGNIFEDVPTMALDIFFARQLQLRNFLLWASPSSRPDFGGKELEDWRLGADWETAAFRQNSGYVYSRETFEAKHIVVELSLGAVAVTALLQSSRISEAEGTSESVGYASAGGGAAISITNAMRQRFALTNYDESASASGALRVLKEVFYDLIRDIHLHQNVFADQLVMNMHRWIRNPNSLLYNPAVSATVSTMMRKLCLLLVAEVNRLGGSVIHCSFTRLFLSTNRADAHAAAGFVESLVGALAQKPMFASLHVGVLQYSKLFLWIDPTNYALVKCDPEERHDESAANTAQVRLHLLMSKCLPEESGCLKVFKSIVAGYLARLAERLREPVTDEEFEAFCSKILTEEITPTLFKLTSKFVEMRHQLKISEKNCLAHFLNPNEVDVPLEFVRCVCKILSMNPMIERRVENVRAQLMLILRVDDASPTSVWQPPPANLVLEYVFCRKCNQSADLNVSTGIAEEADGSMIFLCSMCKAKHSSELVEEMLIERSSRIVQSAVLQDYRCRVCNKIAMSYLAKQCDCSNALENTVPADEFRNNLRMIGEVAKRHNLKNLSFFVDRIFDCYE